MLRLYTYQLVEEDIFLQFYKKIQAHLPKALKEKIASFKFAVDQQRSLMAHLIVRVYYAQYLNKPWASFELVYNQQEKPQLAHFPQEYFNISHSGNRVVVAFSDQEIGIDIEKNKGDRRYIAHRFFTEEEIFDMKDMASEYEQIQYFYRLWSLKESYMKAIGKGISMSLSSFAFKKENKTFSLLFSVEDSDWYFHTPDYESEYQMSICTKKEQITESKNMTLDELYGYCF